MKFTYALNSVPNKVGENVLQSCSFYFFKGKSGAGCQCAFVRMPLALRSAEIFWPRSGTVPAALLN